MFSTLTAIHTGLYWRKSMEMAVCERASSREYRQNDANNRRQADICGWRPLVVSSTNPRYFRFLKERGHNFIRLWRWEHVKSQAASGSFHLCMAPQPWLRTVPGTAKDGKPKFDLEAFDQGYFDRLRDDVVAAGNAGIYVSVMLFEGWALHLSPPPDNVEGHPFHLLNNINDVGITSIVDYQVLPLDPKVQALQEAYIRRVVDTVHDLPNVLYEVANESSGGGSVDGAVADALGVGSGTNWGDSTEWQYWVIDVVKRHEAQQGYASHPIGMTMQYPVAIQTSVNDPLLSSAAGWISPGYDDEIFAQGGHPAATGSPPSHWYGNPPPADGTKVMITDTDHYAPGQGDALWAWKSFLRGHHPILMDFGLIGDIEPAEASPAFQVFEAARFAMGDTLRYAERVNLMEMAPRGELSSSGYVLANSGREYLVLQPAESGEPFTMLLEPATYAIEWYSVPTRESGAAANLTAEADAGVASVTLSPPFRNAGPVVLYLARLAMNRFLR